MYSPIKQLKIINEYEWYFIKDVYEQIINHEPPKKVKKKEVNKEYFKKTCIYKTM